MYRVVERQRVVMGVGLIVHSGSGKEDELSFIPAPRDWEKRAINETRFHCSSEKSRISGQIISTVILPTPVQLRYDEGRGPALVMHQLQTGRLSPQSDQSVAGEPVALVFVVQFLQERRNAQGAALPAHASNRQEGSDVGCTCSTRTFWPSLFTLAASHVKHLVVYLSSSRFHL
jgi:hypothetical protein